MQEFQGEKITLQPQDVIGMLKNGREIQYAKVDNFIEIENQMFEQTIKLFACDFSRGIRFDSCHFKKGFELDNIIANTIAINDCVADGEFSAIQNNNLADLFIYKCILNNDKIWIWYNDISHDLSFLGNSGDVNITILHNIVEGNGQIQQNRFTKGITISYCAFSGIFLHANNFVKCDLRENEISRRLDFSFGGSATNAIKGLYLRNTHFSAIEIQYQQLKDMLVYDRQTYLYFVSYFYNRGEFDYAKEFKYIVKEKTGDEIVINSLPSFVEKTFDTVLKLTSGYGYKPYKLLWTFILVTMLLSIFYNCLMIRQYNNVGAHFRIFSIIKQFLVSYPKSLTATLFYYFSVDCSVYPHRDGFAYEWLRFIHAVITWFLFAIILTVVFNYMFLVI